MYTVDEKVIIWLTTHEFMSYKKAKFIVDNFDDLSHFAENIKSYKSQLSKALTEEEINELSSTFNISAIDRLVSDYNEINISIVTIRSDAYPELLKEIDSPPILLYCKGDVSLLKSECLGVVGTRRATKYGKEVCEKMIRDIASDNITIVSGLADGIDTIAHKSCLEVKGKTIAVLAGGLLNIYPYNNIGLSEKIVENGGLLITEYKPGEQSLTFHFPIRNRIIAGLSKGVFIVEATEKSGSMHTKNFAIDYNREVFALPARVGDIYSVGCNKIIQNGQARMVLQSKDIIEFFGKQLNNTETSKAIQLTYDEQMIYDALIGQELHFDEIAVKVSMDTKTLTTMLMRMELKGLIIKLPNNYYKLAI